MRTPWKMLADLVSGKSSKDETETEHQAKADEAVPPLGGTVDTIPSAELPPADPTPVEDNLARTPEPENSDERDDTREPVGDENARPESEVETAVVDRPSIEKVADVTAPAATGKQSDKPATRQRVAKAPAPVKTRRAVAPRRQVEAVLPALDLLQSAEPAPRSAADEMADLDREIEDLRQRLADKLKRQNAQLRALINRYEGT